MSSGRRFKRVSTVARPPCSISRPSSGRAARNSPARRSNLSYASRPLAAGGGAGSARHLGVHRRRQPRERRPLLGQAGTAVPELGETTADGTESGGARARAAQFSSWKLSELLSPYRQWHRCHPCAAWRTVFVRVVLVSLAGIRRFYHHVLHHH